MKTYYTNIPRNSLILLVLLALSSCHKTIQSESQIYYNDFEASTLNGIQGGIINTFNSTNVIGFYNNSGFTLTIPGVEKHDMIQVTFDLYLHDSWGGNNTGNKDVVDGPDTWGIHLNGKKVMNTTFSNSGCFPTYCQQQSYPNNFPFHNYAGSGASRLDLPGRCSLKNVIGGTTMYRINKLFNHTDGTLIIKFSDLLKQTNATDMLCDESWSMDNVTIKSVTLD